VPLVTHPDGYEMFAPCHMYWPNERSVGRRELSFPEIHNLYPSVIARTIDPPMTIVDDVQDRRTMLWDMAAALVRAALADIPPGSHVVVCANEAE
jgi:hypothetical protein